MYLENVLPKLAHFSNAPNLVIQGFLKPVLLSYVRYVGDNVSHEGQNCV